MEAAFDALAFARRMEDAGMDRKIAEAQAEALRSHSEAQARVFRHAIDKQDAAARKDLATKADISALKSDLRETELRLENKIQGVRIEVRDSESRIRNWLIGTMLTLIGVIATGIGIVISRLPQ